MAQGCQESDFSDCLSAFARNFKIPPFFSVDFEPNVLAVLMQPKIGQKLFVVAIIVVVVHIFFCNSKWDTRLGPNSSRGMKHR